MSTLVQLLEKAAQMQATDLHIASGMPPLARVNSALVPVAGTKPLSREEAEKICLEEATKEQEEKLNDKKELDFSFGVGKDLRIRANCSMNMGAIAGAFRLIPYKIRSAEELGLPKALMSLTEKPRGLVLVTGPTGSGKSTTLAAMIEKINSTVPAHIITIEDPIEYVYEPKKSLISQREVGYDTMSFNSALKYILRQDPDVVMIGEMRDLETIQAAITVAETGHLVFATLHTSTATQTIDRIIDVFPPHQQPQIRMEMSLILEGVVSQQLIPKSDGGLTLATEILTPTAAIRNLIREGKTHQIYSQMQMGQESTGMTTMNQSLAKLVKDKAVDIEMAASFATDEEEFKRLAGAVRQS